MGNRAVITTNTNLEETGVYVHWNGGRDSIEAFLAYCDLRGYRKPEEDCYGWAALTTVINNFFGCFSCGVDRACWLDTDNYDNGTYIIKDWRIVGRMFKRGGESYWHDFKDLIYGIDEKQPENLRLTKAQWERLDEVYEDVKKYRKHRNRDATGKFCKNE